MPLFVPVLIFAGTYLVLAIGGMPGTRIDRTGAAIIGAALMVGSGVLTLEEAYRAVHADTLILLFGMMIVVANLRLAGFFTVVSEWVVEHAHHPLGLLAAVVTVSGVLSAFFVNDTVCVALTPLVLEVVLALGRNPVPYLLGLAMGSNIGSVATITGNPQNMMIGSFSGIHYRDFAAALAPVAAAGLLIAIATLAILYRNEFGHAPRVTVVHRPMPVNRVLLVKALVASGGMIALFFAGWPVPKVALIAGALLLITRRVKPEKVYRQIDFSLLVMFTGLFVVVAGIEKTFLAEEAPAVVARLHLEKTGVLTAASAVLSNLVSNVPAVLVFKPFLVHVPDAARAWLTLAMSSTLAGNLTILGSVANLIVVERARRQAPITFREHFRAGAPVTVLSLALGAAWLS